jgi:hypothetical protein
VEEPAMLGCMRKERLDSGGRRWPVTPLGFRLLAVVRAELRGTLEHQDETSTPFYNNLYDGPPGGIEQSSIFHD